MRYPLSLLLFVLAFITNARQITPDEALAAAQDFFNNSDVEQSRATRDIRSRALNTAQSEDSAPYYIFNATDNNGFVIISGDDRATKVLGYSDKGNFDIANIPPQLSAILDQFAESLTKLSDSTHPSWIAPRRTASTDGGVLLETANWGQGYPYNNKCPKRGEDHCPTGCIATAMAIVMQYNQWPQQARGAHKVNAKKWINFNDVYFDWTKMSNKGNRDWNEEEIDEVSSLMLYLGRSIDMNYNLSGSGANDALLGRYMHDYFRYSIECQTLHKNSFSQQQWEEIMRGELNQNHPIIYGGYSTTEGGHEFVCDGYKDDKYHINWGWDGYANGFYDITTLLGFSNSQTMVINIYPDAEEDGKYSQVFVDKCYYSVIGPTYEPCGLNMNVSNIEPNVPFYVSVAQLEAIDNQYSCLLALAIVNKEGQIKDFVKVCGYTPDADPTYPQEAIAPFFTENLMGLQGMDVSGYFSNNNVFCSTINYAKVYTDCQNLEPTDRLQLVSRRIADPDPELGGIYDDYSFIEDDWKIVAGTLETPTSIPVCNYTPIGATLTWNLPDGIYLQPASPDYDNTGFVLRNDASHFILCHGHGLCNVKVNGEPYAYTSVNHLGTEIVFYPTQESYIIDVDFTPYENTDFVTINLTEAGSLSSRIEGKDLSKISELTLSGPIDIRDLYFIRDYILNLEKLDLSSCDIKAFENYPANSLINPAYEGIGGLYQNAISSNKITDLRLPESIE